METCIFTLKSCFQLANFSAHKPDVCWHDIFDALLLYNLQTASFHPVRKQVRALNRRREHDYKPNRNVSGGLLKRFVVRFFLRPRAELADALAEYRRLVLMNLEPECPGRDRERRRRVMRGTERHVHKKTIAAPNNLSANQRTFFPYGYRPSDCRGLFCHRSKGYSFESLALCSRSVVFGILGA